jgi:hypothetical protein
MKKAISMPDFLNEFASSIDYQKEVLKERMLRGKPNPLRDTFKKHFSPLWKPLANTGEFTSNVGELGVTAVDSSLYLNLLSTGGIFYVIRSLAVCKGKENKRLQTNVFFTKSGLLEAHYYIGTKMEMLEFQAAIDALKNGSECSAILIDGSLYGRAMHVPIETKIEEDRTAVLEFFETYAELLDLCRKKGILVAGVSKESRATFFRDFLLKQIFVEELEETDIEAGDKQRLSAIFPEVLENEKRAFSKFRKLKGKLGSKLETIELVLTELTSSRPDYQLVMNFAESVGYTQPLVLGPSTKAARRMRPFGTNPKKHIVNNFPITTKEKGKEFVEWGSEIISSIPSFPSFISFYLLMDVRDSPMRIDVPCWEQPLSKTGWPKPIDVDIQTLLKIMVSGYCGLDAYNLWLKNVDERVRLKKRVVDTIYFPFMERLFGAKIIRGRGYRRVRYP